MKALQFYLTTALCVVCLGLSALAIKLNRTNQKLQIRFQSQQDEINRGTQSLQIGQNLVKDMAEVSVKNEKIKLVLARNGFTVNVNPTPSPSPAQ